EEDTVAGQVDGHEVGGGGQLGDVGGEDRHPVEDPLLFQAGDLRVAVDGRVDQHLAGGQVAGRVVDVVEQAPGDLGVGLCVEERRHLRRRVGGCHPLSRTG